jgi:hypothetical protein
MEVLSAKPQDGNVKFEKACNRSGAFLDTFLSLLKKLQEQVFVVVSNDPLGLRARSPKHKKVSR